MKEVQEFRKSVVTWLTGISGVSALVASRVYYLAPAEPADLPMVTFTLSREPMTDYPAHAWTGVLTIELHAPNPEDLDTLEDAIQEDTQRDIENGATALTAALSTANKTRVLEFALSSVPDDQLEFDPTSEAFVCTARKMAFDFALVALAEG